MRQFKPGQLQSGSLYPITASFALTASYLSGSISIDTGSLVTTASFNAFTASYTTGSFTGSFKGDGSGLTNLPIPIIDTGSLVTTASFFAYTASQTLVSQSFNSRINTLTSSVDTLTISYNSFTSSYTTGSFTGSFTGILTGTASLATTASYYTETDPIFTAKSGSFVTTSSFNSFTSSIQGQVDSLTAATSSYMLTSDTASMLAPYVLTSSTSSMTVLSASYAETSSYVQTAQTASFITASNVYGPHGLNSVISSSHAISSSYLIGGTDLFVTSTTFNTFTSSYNTGSFTGSFTGTLHGTASWSTNSVTASFVTASNVSGIVASASYAETASYAQTASYILNAISSSYSTNALSASFANTASYVTPLSQQIILSGSLKLDPTQDPDPNGTDLDSTVFFQSSSNTALGYDLYVRQNGNLVKWKWIEGILETGLLYGGAVTYSGSNVFVSPGSGIIADHNATTGSEVSPMIEYVTWNAITQSITNIATQQVTYLYIDNNGVLQQQSTRFTSQQYHDYIPLGAVGHFDYTQVSAFGGGVQTAYDQISQISNFVDAFGPLKMSGYGLTGQPGSLRLSVGSGTSFIHGGFYQNNPEFPSQTTTPSQATASMARVQRSGSVIEFDTNAGNLYTVVDPTKYDRDGDGILHSVGSGNWSIQRVYIDPKTGVLYVYYGQARYTSLLNALQYLPTDPFTEGETFDFTTFVGYLVLKGNASNIADTANNSILNGGLFRGSGQGSGGGIAISNLDDLTDVSITSPTNGQALIYNAGIWQNGNPTSASFAQTALSASFAPSTPTFPYTGSALITGSLGITGSLSVIDGNGANNLNTNVRTLYGGNSLSIEWGNRKLYDSTGSGSLSADWRNRLLHDTSTSQSLDWTNRKLYDNNITPLLSVDWQTRDLTDTNARASINWSSRILTDSGTPGGSGIPVTSIDWENRQANDQFNVTSTDWNNRYLYDDGGNLSIEWDSRNLYDVNGNTIIDYSGAYACIYNHRPTIEDLSLDAQNDFTQGQVFGLNGNVAGNIINVSTNVDLAVTASNPVFLDTDGIWKRSNQTTDTTTKLLGICVAPYSRGNILTEGMITVTTASGYPATTPFVSGNSFYGMPVYLTGSVAAFTTDIPTSGYVRVVGHMYYNSATTPDYWIMKFNPSNDWYEI